MLNTPDVILSAAVTTLAILIGIGFAIMVARVRLANGVLPPAMSGNPKVERALRVQGNTVEGFVLFVPALWLATLYFHGWIPPLIGLIWCLGRILFAIGYMKDAEKRHIGFRISMLSVVALVLLTIWGLVVSWGAAIAA
jgi:glutathione S-transferase